MLLFRCLRRVTILILVAAGILVAVALLYQRRLYQQTTYQGKFVREWAVELTIGPDPTNHVAATAALQALGSNAVRELRRMLRSKDPFYARTVMNYQRKLSPPLRQYVLKKAGGGEAINMHIMGARALGCIGPAAHAAVPDLIATLRGWEPEARWAAADSLGKIGAAAVPALMVVAGDPDVGIRHAAICALGVAGETAAPAAPILFARLSDTNEHIRASALDSFIRIGPAALPVALTNFASSQPAVHATAAKVLLAIGTPSRIVWPQLKAMSTNANAAVRCEAFEMMAGLRFFNTNAVKTYLAALTDAEPGVRLAAIKALSEVGAKAQPAIPVLVVELKSSDPALREWSARTLGRIGNAATDTAPSLRPLLQDPVDSVRIAAREALEGITGATTSAP